ncbi:MAG: peroxidase-related enzyme [Gammaproteobacteria bacterium AqS3]|nr:peroxidase-related enzyme [Gammaproteobacteria bacterium AqS3]
MSQAANTDFSRYPVPDLNELPDDLKQMVLKIQEKTGFIPNVFLAKAHRPEELRAFSVYHDALMYRESVLTKAEIEMIVVATSGENNCLYCVIAHGAILRIRAKHPLLADQIATNYRKADITPRQRAMLDFAVKVTNDSAALGEADFAALHECGFNDEDIWDIGSIAAFFAMSNRMANLVGIKPNAEFYSMGRDIPLPE